MSHLIHKPGVWFSIKSMEAQFCELTVMVFFPCSHDLGEELSLTMSLCIDASHSEQPCKAGMVTSIPSSEGKQRLREA